MQLKYGSENEDKVGFYFTALGICLGHMLLQKCLTTNDRHLIRTSTQTSSDVPGFVLWTFSL